MKALKLVLVLLAASLAAAQEFPRYEVSTSYSYGRVDNVNVASPYYSQGWVGSFATNLKRWVALETEAGGQYNNLLANIQGSSYSLNSGFYSFLTGPRLAYRKGRIVPFAHGLFGISRALAYGKATYDPTRATVFVPYENGFGGAVGGGMDYSISRRLALRTQADYFFTQPGGIVGFGSQNNFRVVAGIVFSFGSAPALSAKASRPTLTPTPITTTARLDATSPEPQASSSAIQSTMATTTVTPSSPTTAAAEPAETKTIQASSNPTPTSSTITSTANAKPASVVSAAPASQPAITTSSTSPSVTPTTAIAVKATSVAPAAPAPKPPVAPPTTALARANPAPANPAPAYAAPARQPEPESLGEIARRYREQKERQQRPH